MALYQKIILPLLFFCAFLFPHFSHASVSSTFTSITESVGSFVDSLFTLFVPEPTPTSTITEASTDDVTVLPTEKEVIQAKQTINKAVQVPVYSTTVTPAPSYYVTNITNVYNSTTTHSTTIRSGANTSGLAKSVSRSDSGLKSDIRNLQAGVTDIQTALTSIDTALASTSLSIYTTNDLAEGSSNLYFTNSRVNAILAATTSLPNLATLTGLTSIGSLNATTTVNGSLSASTFYGDGSHLSGITSFSTSTTRSVFSAGSGLTYNPSTGVFTNASSSPWTNNGSSIYYNGGNVGIGTTTPAYKLDVNGNIALKTGLRLFDSSETNPFDFYNDGSTLSITDAASKDLSYHRSKFGICGDRYF